MSGESPSKDVVEKEEEEVPSPEKESGQVIIRYSREELIRFSELPASKAKPNFFQSNLLSFGQFDESGVWSPVKSSDRSNGPGTGVSIPFPGSSSRQTEQDLKTRLGPQNPGNWFRGCDPKNLESPATTGSGQTNNGKTSEVISLRPRLDTLERKEMRGRDIPVREGVRRDSHSGSASQSYEWRGDKGRLMDSQGDRDRDRPSGGRFANLDYDSRPRGGSRSQSFNNQSNFGGRTRDEGNSRGYNNNYRGNNGYEEATPEWMDEPTSKFEMMSLGGFEDDHRGQEEEKKKEETSNRKTDRMTSEDKKRSTPKEQIPEETHHDFTPEERSVTPEFERLMKDMLKFTEDDPVPDQSPPEADLGSKSSRWFASGSFEGGHAPVGQDGMRGYAGFPDAPRSARFDPQMPGYPPVHQQHQMMSQASEQPNHELLQLLQRARSNINQSTAHHPPPAPVTQFRSLDEIEGSLRSAPQFNESQASSSNEDKQAFNKLMDLLSRRGSGQQAVPASRPNPEMPSHLLPEGVRRPTSYELEELNRRRKMMEVEQQMQQMQSEQQQQQQPQSVPTKRSYQPAFNMVPIQVIRNANTSERRHLLPSASDPLEGASHAGPRAIVGSGRQAGAPVGPRIPSGYGPDLVEMQRQMMMNQEMMQRRAGMNMSPITARSFPSSANSIPIHRPLNISEGPSLMHSHPRPLLGPAAGIPGPHSPSGVHLPSPVDLEMMERKRQIRNLQDLNQQMHQMNPTQLQQTRGMNPAQIQQFLMRS